MTEDTKVPDDCLKLIFEEFSLSERANLRLVSKRFKKLCDSIEIRRLVVFENAARSPGQLVYSGEKYELEDTISIGDLNQLFNNHQIIQQMQHIETLVIYACHENCEVNEYELSERFTELRHLELYNINFTTSDIVAFSKSLECLKLYNVHLKSKEFFTVKMNDYVAKMGAYMSKKEEYLSKKDELWFVDDRGNSSPTYLFLGLEQVISGSLRYFSTNLAWDMSRFFADCINSGIFESLEWLDLVAYDLEYLGYLIEKSPQLKVIHLKFYKLSTLFEQLASESDWANIASQFRADQSVYLYNLLWNRQTSAGLFRFLSDLSRIKIPGNADVLSLTGEGELNFIVLSSVYKHLSGRAEAELTKRLFEAVDILQTTSELVRKDKQFFELFRNCVKINLDVSSPSIEWLDAFPKLTTLRLEFQMIEYDEEILSPIEDCARLQNLMITLCNNVSTFDFLFELRGLRSAELQLLHPIDQVAVLQLIRELKYLQKLDVCFVKSNSMTKAELGAFRKSVNSTFRKKFKEKGLRFVVEIYTRPTGQFARYLLDSADRINVGAHRLAKSEENRMFGFI